MPSRSPSLLPRLALVAAALLALAAPARADDASEALLHFELGSTLYRERRYAEALDHFLAANRLAPNPSYAFNVAQTYALLGRPRDAYNWYETFLREHTLSDADRADGERRRDALAPGLAILEVASDPAGAQIFVDRVELGSLGRAPRRLAVEPGPRTLVLRAPDRVDARVEVVARTGEIVEATASLAAVLGAISIETEPPGATVRREEGEVLGATPLRRELALGEHTVVLELEGYVAQRFVLRVRAGQIATIDVELSRSAATTAQLSVIAEPAGAEVRLAGDVLGAAPLTREGLPPGTRRLEVRAPGHEPYEIDLVLEAGASTHVRASLRDPSRGPWEGGFVLGYGGGALLALGALGCGAATLAARDGFHGALYTNPTRDALDRESALALASDVLGITALALLVATLIADLATGPPPPSTGTFEIAR